MSYEVPKNYSSEQQLPKIIGLVARKNNINLSSETMGNMEVIATACGIADDEVDRCSDKNKRNLIVDNAMGYLFGDEELADTGSLTNEAYQESMGNLKDFVDELSEEKRHVLELRLKIWSRLSEEQRENQSLRESSRMRLVDLNATGGIYLAAINKEERQQDNYRSFYRDFRRMVRVAGMIDDAMDMPDDYENEIKPIEPTMKNRAYLMMLAASQGIRLFSYSLNPGIVADSVGIMRREFRRRTTINNYEQYNIDSPLRE